MSEFLQVDIDAFQVNPWAFLATPSIIAIACWATNVITLKMMFVSIEFIGIKPIFGWQGIVPRKAHKMASIACDLMLERLVNVREVFQRIDPNRITSDLEKPFLQMTKDVIDNLIDLVTRHVELAVDEQAGITKSFVVLAVGGRGYKG